MPLERTQRVDDRVIDVEDKDISGKIIGARGPNIEVFWVIPEEDDDGVWYDQEETCFYKCYDMEWSGADNAWLTSGPALAEWQL